MHNLGIKVKTENQIDSVVNKSTANKTIFEFNDTVLTQSFIQVNSKNVTGFEVDLEKSLSVALERNHEADLFDQNVSMEDKIENDAFDSVK